MFRSIVSLFGTVIVKPVAGIGLVSIWSEAVPTLQILKRIQIWPSITLMQETAVSGTKLTEDKPVPVGAFRCTSCGYLECYARPEFEAE